MSKTKRANEKRNNYKKNNGRNQRRDKKDYEKKVQDEAVRSGDAGLNDWQWYAANAQLLTDAASLSFYNRLGDKIDINPSTEEGKFTIPGVARIGVIPTYGKSADFTSAINVSAQSYYSFVRHQNSGNRVFESSDLMMYMMGADNLFSFLTWMTRAYGVARTYSQLNKYYPKAILTAMQIDFDSIQKNMPTFLWYINQFAAKISVFAVPGKATLFNRHAWMYSNLYMDSPDVKAQTYVFSPDIFLKYSPKTSETGGELVPIIIHDHSKASHLLTIDEIMSIGDELVNAMLADEDCGIISGDILKAFGDNLHRVGTISADYEVKPVYQPEVLSQINNITPMGYLSAYTFKQEGNVILHDLTLHAYDSGRTYNGNRILNMKTPIGTDPASVMVATRLSTMATTSVGSETPNGAVEVHPTTYASEIISGITIIGFDAGNNQIVGTYPSLVYCINPSTTNVNNMIFNLMNLEYFDWHPQIINDIDAGSLGTRQWVCGDLDNYSVITENDLKKLHDCAILNMFTVPEMGHMSK